MPWFLLDINPAVKQWVFWNVQLCRQGLCLSCSRPSAWCWHMTGTQTLPNGQASPHLPQFCPLDLGSARWPPSTDLPCFLMKGQLWKAAQVTYTQLGLESDWSRRWSKRGTQIQAGSKLPGSQVLLLHKFSHPIQKSYFCFWENTLSGYW